MSDVKTEVKLHLEQTQPEGLAYMDCPECGGPRKLMLIPLDDGGTFYRCLKASCDTAGSVGSTYVRKEKEKGFTRTTYPHYQRDPTWDPLEVQDMKFFRSKFALDGTQAQLLCDGYLHGQDRYVFPIRNEVFKDQGYVARAYDDRASKAYIRPYTQHSTLMAWYGHDYLYTQQETGILILLEDQPSAVRLSKYFPTVSLLGTNLSDEDARLIEQVWKGRVLIMLDADAAASGMKMAHRMKRASSWVLTDHDPKDMPEATFEKTVEHIYGL